MPEPKGVPSLRPSLIAIDLQFFSEEKTEQPTQKKKQDSRRKGQVAKSNEFGTAFLFLAGFGVLYLLASYFVEEMFGYTRHLFNNEIHDLEFTLGELHPFFIRLVWQGVRVAGPILAAAFLVGLISQMAQVGFLFTAEPLKPKLERINPLAGFKRIFSKRAIVELLKAVFKIGLVAWVTWVLIRGQITAFPQLILLHPVEAVSFVGDIVFRIGLWVGITLIVIAAADYSFQRYEQGQNLMMTKKEVREELRQSEGDPMLRSRMRQRQREIASRRMMAEVPTADVIVTNPTHLAAALRYDAKREEAPVLVAKGAGRVAERIKEIAGEHDIPVVQNVWLARTLCDAVSVGMAIPETLYQAVAELLAFVYRLKHNR